MIGPGALRLLGDAIASPTTCTDLGGTTMLRRCAAALSAAVLAAGLLVATGPVATSAEAAPRTFKNCGELNRVYPHGVGRTGARDRTSGRPVTTFRVDTAVYNANTRRDGDKDGIACEKR